MIAINKHTRSYDLSVEHLTKKFGSLTAVNDLSFTVRPGAVTAFLGPNGSGKTTTLRILLGLAQANSGTALIGGSAYSELKQPASIVGASLDASSFHPGRSARNHLRILAPHVGADNFRVDEILDLVGLSRFAKERVGGFSTGMKQRLSLATALLGDPAVLVLDEPNNGIDPEGVVWLRSLLRHLAAEGRTVLVSSHVLSEVEHTVDDVVIIARGQLMHASSLDDLRSHGRIITHVESPNQSGLDALSRAQAWVAEVQGSGFDVEGRSSAEVGAESFAAGIEIHHLSQRVESLEEVFLRLTADPKPESVEVAS